MGFATGGDVLSEATLLTSLFAGASTGKLPVDGEVNGGVPKASEAPVLSPSLAKDRRLSRVTVRKIDSVFTLSSASSLIFSRTSESFTSGVPRKSDMLLVVELSYKTKQRYQMYSTVEISHMCNDRAQISHSTDVLNRYLLQNVIVVSSNTKGKAKNVSDDCNFLCSFGGCTCFLNIS